MIIDLRNFCYFGMYFLFAASGFAYQPKIVESNDIILSEPEISKAYFVEPKGQPQIYRINAKAPFDLQMILLVPDVAGQEKNLTVVVSKVGDPDPIATINGSEVSWKQSYELPSRNAYWRSSDYQTRLEVGDYEIRVSSPINETKYALVIGNIEVFNLKEALAEMDTIPRIKSEFFNESPALFLLSPLGIAYVLGMFFFSFIFGFGYRFLFAQFLKGTPNAAPKNIDTQGRLMRFGVGVALFIWAVFISWSPIVLFFAGFCFFEAIFSWCGLYAALGKNSCPL